MVHIYKLIDPITGSIRYVGKTKTSLKRRLTQHLTSQNLSHRSHTTNWLNKLKLEGYKPIIELIETVGFDKWEERERFWISYYNTFFVLTNTTPGGDSGSLNYKHTEEAKNRISKLNSRPKSKEWIENAKNATRKAVATPIIQLDLKGTYIKEWISFYEAADFLIDPTRAKVKNIQACCRGKRKSAYGFKWVYKKDAESKDKEPLS